MKKITTMLCALLVTLVPAALVTAAGQEEGMADEVMTVTWMSRFPDSAGEQHLEEKIRGQHREQRRLAVPREGEGGHPACHRRAA